LPTCRGDFGDSWWHWRRRRLVGVRRFVPHPVRPLR
jgi:hypothetical protein